MARGPFLLVLRNPTGSPLSGVTGIFTQRGTNVSIPIYAAETGSTTVPPISNSLGEFNGWMDQGEYHAEFSAAGYTPHPLDFDISGPPDETQGRLQVIAGADLSGQRLVSPQADGTVVYASNALLANLGKPLWLTVGAISNGATGIVLYEGLFTEPSWTWTPGERIFLGTNGLLTQTVPTASSGATYLLQVASAISAVEIFYDVTSPIALI